MSDTKKDPVLVVLQLSGGNDYFNTVIPYTDPLYRDNRPAVGVAEDRIIPIDDKVGFHPSLAPMKGLYDQGKMAIIHGVGYANSPRSHFRSMDIWHTCEPDKLGTEGWLGKGHPGDRPRQGERGDHGELWSQPVQGFGAAGGACGLR